MARPTGTMTVKDLIDRGTLHPGEKVVLQRISAPPIEGSLEADGSITVAGRTYRTPSTAARYALNGRPIDGWLRWRVPRLGNRHLASLRDGQ